MSLPPLDLIVRQAGEHTLLCCPAVGYFTLGPRPGQVLTGGQVAGQLVTLARTRALLVPEGVAGRVQPPAIEGVELPAAYGQVLIQLAPLVDQGGASAAAGPEQAGAGGLFVRAPHAGRFWQRASPGEAPLVQVGDMIEAGRALGLIEVMKTFAQVHYRPTGGLPERARVVRMLVADGGEIEDRAKLIEVEPA